MYVYVFVSANEIAFGSLSEDTESEGASQEKEEEEEEKKKPASSSSDESLAHARLPADIERNIRRLLNNHPLGLVLDRFTQAYADSVGMALNVVNLGFDNVTELLESQEYVVLQKEGAKPTMVRLSREEGPHPESAGDLHKRNKELILRQTGLDPEDVAYDEAPPQAEFPGRDTGVIKAS